MSDSTKIWVFFAVCLGFILGLKVLWWWGAQPSPRPGTMPADSVWIAAPSLPVSWHHGWWFGCWIDSDGHSNRCRLWTARFEKRVEFEGQYVSCQTHSPVPANELKLKAPVELTDMWVVVPTEKLFAPAAFLKNGNYLVPVDSIHGCEQVQQNLRNKR
jgi:hypothetical protein